MKKTINLILFTCFTAFSWAQALHDNTYKAKTYCNPLNIDYAYEFKNNNSKEQSFRSAADPIIITYKGDYYLFATNQRGYHWSSDLGEWHYIHAPLADTASLPDDLCAPAAWVSGDTMFVMGSYYGNQPIWMSTDPKKGTWKVFNEAHEIYFWDPSVFKDDDGRFYAYWGSSNVFPIRGVELDYNNKFRAKGSIHDFFTLRPELHGWERFGENNNDTDWIAPFMEGAWVNKYRGAYYLQYGAPGTEFKTYAEGVYVSKNPLGPFTYQSYNPFCYKPGGFVRGSGHGGTFEDNFGNFWHIATCHISVKYKFERRVGLYPTGFDSDGQMYSNTAYGDYPLTIPAGIADHRDNRFTNMMLLSYKKPVKVSSTEGVFMAQNASDENMKTYWCAKTGKAGEWLQMDLGNRYQVQALQINFAEHNARIYGKVKGIRRRYKVFCSNDGKNWTLLIDKSQNEKDVPHDYIELSQTVETRYLKLENIEIPSGLFAVMDLRVFGKGFGEKPQKVGDFTIKRETDRRNAMIKWQKTPTAYAYNVYFGIAPNKLYNSILVYDDNFYNLRALDRDANYYFAIEAVGENGVSERSAVVKVE